MPDISAARNASVFFIVIRNLYSIQYLFGCNDLIRAHNQKHVFGSKHAVFRQNIQNRMLCEKRLGKIDKVGNNAIFLVRPKGSKFKRITRFAFSFGFHFLNMIISRRVGIIFRISSVRYNKDLNVFEKPAVRPKTIALIAVDLIKRFPYIHAAAFQFDMYKGQPVYKNGNVVTVFIIPAVFLVLMDNLQLVVVNILFIE